LKVLVSALAKSVKYMHKKNIIVSFIAGFLIGICATMLTINILNMNKRILPDTEASLKKTDETLQESQQTRPTVNNLTAAKEGVPDEGVKAGDKALAAPQGKDAAVPKSQDEIAPGGIKVYVHYAGEKDKELAEAFSAFLRTKGYASVDAENIKHRHRDIRYFHGEDEKAALLLQKQFNDFIAGSTYVRKFNLNIRDLSKIYSGAKKGSLEVWVFF